MAKRRPRGRPPVNGTKMVKRTLLVPPELDHLIEAARKPVDLSWSEYARARLSAAMEGEDRTLLDILGLAESRGWTADRLFEALLRARQGRQ